MTDRIEVYDSNFGIDGPSEYRWRYRHENSNILADSGQGYSRRIDCLSSAFQVVSGRPVPRSATGGVLGSSRPELFILNYDFGQRVIEIMYLNGSDRVLNESLDGLEEGGTAQDTEEAPETPESAPERPTWPPTLETKQDG